MKTQMLSRKRVLLYVSLILLILSLHQASAISFGASPGVLSFDNLLKDGYAEHYVTISTNSLEPIAVEGELIGNYTGWLNFEPENLSFTVQQNKPFRVKVIVTPPEDASNGDYSSYVRFISQEFAKPSGTVGSSVRASVMIRLKMGITGKEIIKCSVGGISLPVSESGYPLQFFSTILNEGNVRIRPRITLDVWDRFQEKLIKTFDVSSESVLPTVKATLAHEFPSVLEPGQYWAYVKISPCGFSSLITFDVAEEGEIIDNGVLESVTAKTWATVNETIPISAKFRNTGKRFVDARFKGTIKLYDEIIKVIESDELRVEPGESVSLDTFFTPKKPGVYEVLGKVLYNRKLTFERGTIINVNPSGEKRTITIINILPFLLYLLIIITIFFLIFKIRKERKKMRDR